MKRQKGKKDKKGMITAVLVIFVAVLMIWTVLSQRGPSSDKSVYIPQGSSTLKIADILKKNDVISSRLMFILKVSASEYRGKLKYGSFDFVSGEGYEQIIEKLSTEGAQRKSVSVVIPEGYSCEKIIERLSEAGLGTKEEFEEAMRDNYSYKFLDKADPPENVKYRLQGFLFPSSYEFFADSSAHDIIDKMLAEFEKQYKTISSSYDGIYDIITKASMIEREAVVDEDRAMIAGVIENRLAKDMKLQIDATVIYAVSDGMYDVKRVLYKDLEYDSPYNTYKYKGLPPGPISSPGLRSIEAALHPKKHNYLFYRTDTSKNDGSHIFTETFESHVNANK